MVLAAAAVPDGAANGSNKAGFEQGNANVAGLLGAASGFARIGLANSRNTSNPWAQNNASVYNGNYGQPPMNPWADMNNATVGRSAGDLLG